MGNAEDLDIVVSMYNLLKYSDNYSMTWGSLCNYCRDEVIDSANEMDDNNNKINSEEKTTNKSFEYKTKIIGSTASNKSRLHQIIIRD